MTPTWGEGRRWGVTCQLATTRSSTSWGIGDFGDLARLGAWLRDVGGDVIAVSPLGDQLPILPRQNSPYFGSSRRWLDPIHLDISRIERHDSVDVSDLESAAHRLNDHPLIDRSAAWGYKRDAFRRIFDDEVHRGHDEDLDRFIEAGGPDLAAHARFCVLTERYGVGWPGWPDDHVEPDDVELRLWAWLQWHADRQLRRASEVCDLNGDVPVGCDPAGADAWADQALMATGWHVGAPPDEFNQEGQDWAIVPYAPDRLAEAAHRPLRAMLAANSERFAGLRLDHVMGLFRLWWVPAGAAPQDGHYAYYDAETQLAIVVDEVNRHHTFIIGEDLGTVEDGVRARLAEAGIPGLAVAWFEGREPEEWPESSVGMLTTHDLPTVVGALSDPAEWLLAERIRRFARCDEWAEPNAVVVEAHRRLAGSRSGMVLATLEDICGSPHRVNRPGTTDVHDNWRFALPVLVDDLAGHDLVRANIDALHTRV